MITKVQKWGNSQGLRLSKELLADVRIDVGDSVDVTVHDGALVITPARRVRGGIDLEQLIGRIPEGYTPCSACHGWGTPQRPMRPAPRRSTHTRRPRTPRGFTRAGLTTRKG